MGASSQGGSSSGGLASGGQSGSSAGGPSNAGAGGARTECSGTFGAPQLVFDSGSLPASSLTLTGDELELYYAIRGTSDSYSVMRRMRAAKTDPFSNPTEVAELSLICAPEQPSMDISSDGLRMYVECDFGSAPLYLATRPDRSSPFELSDESVGLVGDSIDVSADELVLTEVLNAESDAHVRMRQRGSRDLLFGQEMPVLGIDGELRSPTLGPDSLELFGTVSTEPSMPRLAVARRTAPSAPFSSPAEIILPGSAEMTTEYTPALSDDCHSLYFLRRMGAAGDAWAVYVTRR